MKNEQEFLNCRLKFNIAITQDKDNQMAIFRQIISPSLTITENHYLGFTINHITNNPKHISNKLYFHSMNICVFCKLIQCTVHKKDCVFLKTDN